MLQQQTRMQLPCCLGLVVVRVRQQPVMQRAAPLLSTQRLLLAEGWQHRMVMQQVQQRW